jgi:hypothetical protein
MSDVTTDAILEQMASLAECMLSERSLSPDIRTRLEAVKNAHPAFAEPPTATGEAR